MLDALFTSFMATKMDVNEFFPSSIPYKEN